MTIEKIKLSENIILSDIVNGYWFRTGIILEKSTLDILKRKLLEVSENY